MKRTVSRVAIVEVTEFESGLMTRIETRFLYPDGHSVDLFVSRDGRTLTDMGYSLELLRNTHFEWNALDELDEALLLYGVRRRDAALEYPM